MLKSIAIALVVAALACAGTSRAAAPVGCTGDCNSDGTVAINELVAGVAQALGLASDDGCTAFDRDADGSVSIAELIAAVAAALDGCPPTPVEFTVVLDPEGPALVLTPKEALRPKTAYAIALTSALTDDMGRPLQASATFRALKSSDEQPGDGPVALFDADPQAPGNPFPDARLIDGNGVHIPDGFALRGLADTPELALARGLLRTTADAVGAVGLFSTTAPIRIPLSRAVDLATVSAESVRFFARPNGQLDLGTVLAQLQQSGVEPRDVALAISFPTTAVEDDLLAVRARLDAREADGSLRVVLTDPDPSDDLVIGVFQRGAPEFADFFATNPDVGTVVHGLVPSPDFRGDDKLFDPRKVSGESIAEPTLLDFYLTLPATAGPHRVVIVQHGFGGTNNFGLTVANDLARAGLAGIAINAVSHGRRGNPLDLLSPNPLQLRDALRQTVADQLAVVRAIQTGIDVDGDGTPDLDATGLGYLGVSLGGIVGGTFIAVEPSIRMAVLNVAGGRVAFLGNNPGVRPIYAGFLAQQVQLEMTNPDFETFIQRLLEIGQQSLDPADPLDYAPHWRREPFDGFAPRRVLMQEGIGDQLVSNDSTEALAAAGGLVAQQAMSDPDGVSGLWRFDPPGGHNIFGRDDVRDQAMRFLASGGTTIVAEGCRTAQTCQSGERCLAPGEFNGCGACQPIDPGCSADDQCAALNPPAVCGPAPPEACACIAILQCIPACATSDDCKTGEDCSPTHHCVATSCTGPEDCPAHFGCTDEGSGHTCERQSCTTDADCDGGFCVAALCYDTPGSCAAPLP